jgi:structure-specific endonuclease subunit SLX1
MWYCYILRNTQEQYKYSTYNGSTNNPMRRLRQHNKEICGGAKATSRTNGGWEICAMVSGFHGHVNALSCEWRIKCPSGRPGKREKKYQSPSGRVQSLNDILKLDRWTGQCTINNSEVKYKLHILREFETIISLETIPQNIEVVVVDSINKDCIELEKEIYE